MDATLVNAGREAASRGEWQRAYEVLAQANAQHALQGKDVALFADAAYAAGHLDVTIEVWERVHANSLRAGDSFAAADAATRVAMHLLFDTALMAPVRGWVKRAERLLDDDSETAVHAWLAVVHSYERMLSGDLDGAQQWARRAIDIGAKHNHAAAAMGRIAEARIVILNGDVQKGLDLLNEAAVATVSGELDALSTGIVYCELVCALQALGQYDLAEQWTEAMERWRHGHAVGSIHGRCRVHRAEILRLRGSSSEAEQEALRACEELRPYLRREYGWPLTELGRIRLQQGDLDGAEEAFVTAHQAGWDPHPGLALVYLARGDVARAAASISDALDHPLQVPSKEWPPNTDLRRAPLLEAQVTIAIAARDLERARWAANELRDVAIRFESKPFAASGALANAAVHLAEGDITNARSEFERSIDLWHQVGAPYETAAARIGLASALRAAGNIQMADLEQQAAESALREIAVLPVALQTAVHASELSQCCFDREGEYWSITFDAQITRVRHTKGLTYIAHLISEPSREFHVLEMIGAPSESDAGPVLDAAAKAAYARRLAEIEEDIMEARQLNDLNRESQSDAERDFLLRELARATGLGGRDRRASSASERARASVTRAVRYALARIQGQNNSLGLHLNDTIRTGTHCVYLPDPRNAVRWRVTMSA